MATKHVFGLVYVEKRAKVIVGVDESRRRLLLLEASRKMAVISGNFKTDSLVDLCAFGLQYNHRFSAFSVRFQTEKATQPDRLAHDETFDKAARSVVKSESLLALVSDRQNSPGQVCGCISKSLSPKASGKHGNW